MDRYTKKQCVFIVTPYFKNNEIVAATVRYFLSKYGTHSDLTSLLSTDFEANRERVAECPQKSV